MARTKKISSEELVVLLETYFINECCQNEKRLKIPAFGQYARGLGYEIEDHTLRRDMKLRERIAEFKNKGNSNNISTVVVFKTLNVDEFLQRNNTIQALKKSLIELDQYYEHVCNSAVWCLENYKNLEKQYQLKKNELVEIKMQLQTRENQIQSLKEANIEFKKEIHALHSILKENLYPEIANELLRKEGILKGTDSNITLMDVNKTLLDDTESILVPIKKNEQVQSDNSVIQGLFQQL